MADIYGRIQKLLLMLLMMPVVIVVIDDASDDYSITNDHIEVTASNSIGYNI